MKEQNLTQFEKATLESVQFKLQRKKNKGSFKCFKKETATTLEKKKLCKHFNLRFNS